LAPAAAADGQCFVFVVNVEFNVAAGALAIPRIFAGFSHPLSHNPSELVSSAFADLKPSVNRQAMEEGDQGESKPEF